MIALLKYLSGPWEVARGYLREDLDHIEAAVNQQRSATFTEANKLKKETITGDAVPATRSITNTGANSAPTWDQINLANGVKNRLPFANLIKASNPPSVVGRSGTGGDFQELKVGTGLTVVAGTLQTANVAILVPASDFDQMLELFRYAFTRIDFLEAALKIEYAHRDISVPDELALLEQ